MYIQIRLKNVGATKLYIQQDASDKENKRFMIVNEDHNHTNIFLKLILEQGAFRIEYKSQDVEEDDDELKDKLDSLALWVVETLQKGIELSDAEDFAPNDIKPYDPSKIRVETKVFSIGQIYDMINDEDLDISPDFQRNEVWDDFRKSRLIESILLRIPLPVFYFSEDARGILSVVDGLQRLSAIKQFMDNKLMLKDLEYLDNCEKKYYNKENCKIDDKYIRWINSTQISANVIDAESPYHVKFDIFRRINTGGKPLNSQELRNCLMNKATREVLRDKMAESNEFKIATGGSITNQRMDGQELAMRFIYFYDLYYPHNLIKNYNGQIDVCLDDLVDKLRNLSKEQLEVYEMKFKTAMNNAHYLFGRHAFRKVYASTDENNGRSLINKALFVSWSVILSQYDPEMIQSLFEENSFIQILGQEIETDNEFFNTLSYGTNGAHNIQKAFEKAELIMNKQFKYNE